MSFIESRPPAPNCGAVAPLTEALRPAVELTKEQAAHARRLKRRDHGLTAAEIAARLGGAPDEVVLRALATIRTRVRRPTRRTLNVGVLEHQFVEAHRQNGEPVWRTMDRLLNERIALRTENLVLRARTDAAGHT
jgi:hypothetical protein